MHNLVVGGSQSSLDEESSKSALKKQRYSIPGQPQISDALKQKIHQELEHRIQQEEKQPQQVVEQQQTRLHQEEEHRIQLQQEEEHRIQLQQEEEHRLIQQKVEAQTQQSIFENAEDPSRMPRGTQLPRTRREEPDKPSYDGDEDEGGCGWCLASLIQWPVIIAASIIIPIFGITFIIMGAINMNNCSIEPMIPIWLIIQGIILLFGIGIGGAAKKTSKNGSVSLPIKLVGFVISLATIAWFTGGNVWVYQAWAQTPDYAHYWFENGCNMSLFNLAFYGIIILDALFILLAIVGCIAFFLRGCHSR
ncbi:uncharacterized protein LOC121873541 [Homarus americanus]|uniref:uncharacterized protein LOC121873541 n=1 Tax=Homarus americanus TaxID=6706 RepID=UPI001C43C3D0|nr:uncharacterized protein LOC121873541 [Homarus americanus]